MDPYERAKELMVSAASHGIEHLNPKEKTLLAIVGLETEVNNGGFDQYYFNSSGDLAAFAPEALDAISAPKTADIVRRANAVFVGGVQIDRMSRQNILIEMSSDGAEPWEDLDQEFYAYPEDLEALLRAYLE